MSAGLLLTVDVGNTQTQIGLYDDSIAGASSDDGLVNLWRVSTVPDRTTDEVAAMFAGFFDIAEIDFTDVTSMAVASGVPSAKSSLRELADQYFDVAPIIIGPGVKTGMQILYDNPKDVGADRIANAVAAFELYGGPAIVVDFGTANNFDIVSAAGEFLGGAISPGIELSMEALNARVLALGAVELIEPRSVIGRSTAEGLQSGALYGYAGSIDGMVARFCEELGEQAVVVATGGLAPTIAQVASSLDHVDPYLTLHGLRVVHSRNV